MPPLKPEFDYYVAHQAELVRHYCGRVIVIKNQRVLGDYAGEDEAIEASTRAGHELGTFLVQLCEPGEDNYTQTFHSRVTFA